MTQRPCEEEANRIYKPPIVSGLCRYNYSIDMTMLCRETETVYWEETYIMLQIWSCGEEEVDRLIELKLIIPNRFSIKDNLIELVSDKSK